MICCKIVDNFIFFFSYFLTIFPKLRQPTLPQQKYWYYKFTSSVNMPDLHEKYTSNLSYTKTNNEKQALMLTRNSQFIFNKHQQLPHWKTVRKLSVRQSYSPFFCLYESMKGKLSQHFLSSYQYFHILKFTSQNKIIAAGY